jgi:hypothetical protein
MQAGAHSIPTTIRGFEEIRVRRLSILAAGLLAGAFSAMAPASAAAYKVFVSNEKDPMAPGLRQRR